MWEVTGVLTRVPDYYEQFRCLAGACPHTCCAKWEVVIDEDTAQSIGSILSIMLRRPIHVQHIYILLKSYSI